jgi:hypothetical protein
MLLPPEGFVKLRGIWPLSSVKSSLTGGENPH